MADLIRNIRPGVVTAVRCADIHSGLAGAKSALDRLNYRIAALEWEGARRVDSMIDQTVTGLARLALALWPAWHSGPSVSQMWRDAAVHYCEAGRLPLPNAFPAGTHAAQLAATLGPDSLVIALIAGKIAARDDATIVRGVAEWLAASAYVPVFILLSEEAAPGVHSLLEVVPSIQLAETDGVRKSSREGDFEPSRAADTKSEPSIDYFPITGAPHPLSPGEQKMAARLLADSELAPLFAFNQRITGHHGNQYIVDLLWLAGRLVVEVDSFQVHGNRFAFAQDRHRDYELMAAGFRVLRITHDEALMDTESAIEKIRQLVRLNPAQ